MNIASHTPDLFALEQAMDVSYPASFHASIADFAMLTQTPSFQASFPGARLLQTAAEIHAVSSRCQDGLLPFLADDAPSPDIYAFDLNAETAEYTVVVWRTHAVVHEWQGFTQFLAWVREQ